MFRRKMGALFCWNSVPRGVVTPHCKVGFVALKQDLHEACAGADEI
jgi:hypothetical protein